jgi:hypothetical protein
MNRARLDLSDFDDTPPNKDPAVLREISVDAGFPSRPAVPAPSAASQPAAQPAGQGASAADGSVSAGFRRPARPTGNRTIAVNTRVEPEIASMIYELRDNDASRKRAIADVIGEAVKLLYDRELGSEQR